jgi:hypothetical protein
MATVEKRYEAATAYVHRAIAVVERGPSTPFDPLSEAADFYAGRIKTASVRTELQHIEERWEFATNDIDRARVARDAELLADRVQESLPGAPQDRKRTNLYPGETPKGTPSTRFEDIANEQFDATWNWLKRGSLAVRDEAAGAGKWLIIGGTILLGMQLIDFLRAHSQRNEQEERRVLDSEVERVANRRNGAKRARRKARRRAR